VISLDPNQGNQPGGDTPQQPVAPPAEGGVQVPAGDVTPTTDMPSGIPQPTPEPQPTVEETPTPTPTPTTPETPQTPTPGTTGGDIGQGEGTPPAGGQPTV